jgi:hypothetical protein
VQGKIKLKKVRVYDRMKNFFDIIHAGEGIFTIGDIGSLMQLLNGLLDEGWYKGGNSRVGWYSIGSPMFPIKHGLILACTIDDLDNQWVKQIGTISRTIVTVYHCQDVEDKYIIAGRTPPYIRIKYSDFSGEVAKLLEHINPSSVKHISFKSEVDENLTKNILKLIMYGRNETTGKRAMNDTLSLLKGHAHLNGRSQVCRDDAVLVEALLTPTRRILLNSNPTKYYFYGSRLHFQIKLRELISGRFDVVKKEINEVFKWWDNRTPLYSDTLINNTYKALHLPIEMRFK